MLKLAPPVFRREDFGLYGGVVFVRAAFLALSCVLAAAACGDDDRTASPDAGPSGIDAGPEIDAGFDAGLEESYLFGPCVVDEQCPGDGAFCRTPDEGYPNGQCTVPCPGGDRGPCDDGFRYNHCLEQEDGSGFFCEYRCLNGADCGRDSYTCVGSFDSMGAGTCVGVCSADEDCGGTAECNVWSGNCVAAGEVPADGSETGGECTEDADCKSNDCLQPYAPGFSGWVDGYCLGYCILPVGYNTNTFYDGETLPQATCAGDSICWPGAGSYGRGDLGVCLDGCTTDADCREDDAFYCLKSIELAGGTSTYTNGVCLPLDCADRACPTGFTCQSLSTSSGTIRRCERT